MTARFLAFGIVVVLGVLVVLLCMGRLVSKA